MDITPNISIPTHNMPIHCSSLAVKSSSYGLTILLINLALIVSDSFIHPSKWSEDHFIDQLDVIIVVYSIFKYTLGILFMLELHLHRLYEKFLWRKRHGNGGNLAHFHIGSFAFRLGVCLFGASGVVRHGMRSFHEYPEQVLNSWKEGIAALYTILQITLIIDFSIVIIA